MEQKKILWIITASGVFLAVVFLFALLICKPTASNNPTMAAITPIEKTVTKSETTTSPAIVVEKKDIENLTSSVEDEKLEEIAESKPSEEKEEIATVNPISKNDDGTVVIDFTQSAEKSAVTPKNQMTAQKMESTKQTEKKADTIYTSAPSNKTAAEIESEKQAVALNSTGAKPPVKEQAKKEVASKNVTNYTSPKSGTVASASVASSAKPTLAEPVKYWVQCASYTSKKTADNARATLDENRIPAEVFTYKDSKDKLFYRVRVGPYTTKSEAEYWKNRIGQLDSFKSAQSYITQN